MRKILFLLSFLMYLGINSQAQQTIATHTWNFDDPVVGNSVEGWDIINYANPNTSNGILNLTASTSMGYPDLEYVIPSGVTLDPAVSKQIVIKLKNGTQSRRARFYWVKNGVGIRYDFLMSIQDTEFNEYVIDLTHDSRWSGNIESIRFEIPMPVPANSNGAIVSVDYIKILEAPATPAPMPSIMPAPFGVNLAGAEFSGSDYQYPHSAELDYFKEKGLTLMRVPFKWERIQPVLDGPLAERDLNELKNIVWEARKRGMWVLLDMHNYVRRTDGGVQRIIGDPALTIAHVGKAWRMIADEFKDFDNIYAYGLMNEPHGMRQDTPWFDIAQGMIDSIRTTDTQTAIMVGGPSYSSSKEWPRVSDNLRLLVDPSHNLIYEAHVYFDDTSEGIYNESYDDEHASPSTGVDRLAPFVNWLNQNGVRGFVGEYGIPDDDPRWKVVLDNALQYLKENGVNGTYWAAGSRWGTNRLSVHPNNDGSDRPQMAILENYLYADTVSITPQDPSGPGELSYWNFDETGGTTAADAWGSNTINLSSGASFVSGKNNNGLKLDGTSNGYATLPNGVVSALDDFTITTWVKLDASAKGNRLFDFGSNTGSNMVLIPGTGGTVGNVRYAIRTTSYEPSQTIGSAVELDLDEWYHIAVTQSGNIGILYVDGVEVGRNESLTKRPSDLGNTSQNWLGKSQWAVDPFLNGTIDDFKIFSRALSAAEIVDEFEGETSTPPSGTEEYSFWDFNETGGTSAADSWGGFNATLASGASFVAGKNGNGLDLDGSSNGYASLPAGIASGLDEITVAGWVKLDGYTNWGRLFDFGTGTSSYMYLTPRNGTTGTVRFTIRGNATTQDIINSPTTLTPGQWYHLAVTLSENEGVLYVNGTEVGRNNSMTFKPSDLGYTSQNWFGKSQFAADPNLNAVIDDMTIFSRALNSTEISDLMSGSFNSQTQAVNQKINFVKSPVTMQNVVVFPNPSSGNFRIDIDAPENGEITISLYNSAGILMRSFIDDKNGSYQKEVNLSNLRPSLYYLKVNVGSFFHSQTLIIE